MINTQLIAVTGPVYRTSQGINQELDAAHYSIDAAHHSNQTFVKLLTKVTIKLVAGYNFADVSHK